MSPFFTAPASLRIQSVLYGNEPKDIRAAIRHACSAAVWAAEKGAFHSVQVAYGDCSPTPVFTDQDLADIRSASEPLHSIEYTYFNANLGSARGHNTLLESAETDFVLIMNPDVRLAPSALHVLSLPFQKAGVGETEARQLPIEHPKEYAADGETSWATTACAMFPTRLIKELGGFDAETFFLYCDDVDMSWRIRLAGYRVIFCPDAVAFHGKRLDPLGGWLAGNAEKYYSAEAALMMAHKYSRPDLVKTYLDQFTRSDLKHLNEAAAKFKEREAAGTLPRPLDPTGKVAEFVGHYYGGNRYTI